MPSPCSSSVRAASLTCEDWCNNRTVFSSVSPDGSVCVQYCFGLPLEDVNGRQMLQEAALLIAKLDPTFDVKPYASLWDVSSCITALDLI